MQTRHVAANNSPLSPRAIMMTTATPATSPRTSGATQLACDIANRLSELDGLAPHIDSEFLASIVRVITSEIDEKMPALLCNEVVRGKDGQLFMLLPESLSRPTSCCCDECKADPAARRQNALLLSPNSRHAWTVHMPNSEISRGLQAGTLKPAEKKR